MDLPKPETSIIKSQAFQSSALMHPGVQTAFNVINRRLTCSGSHAAYFCKVSSACIVHTMGRTSFVFVSLLLGPCASYCEMGCPNLEVAGPGNGADSQDLFSFSKELSSWNANIPAGAPGILQTLSQCELCLFLSWMGLPPGDRSIIWSLISFISFKISNMFGTCLFFWFFEWWL